MTSSKTEVTPLPAATVTLVRDAPRGLEVLMLQRSMALKFMPGAYVFPGGALDPGDDAAGLRELCVGLDDAAASRTLGMERGGLAYWIAAIREAFEEAGILLAYDASGRYVSLNGAAADRFRACREALEKNHGAFAALARAEGLRLATDRLLYFGHWITPVTVPRRYDTRFFLAVAPEGQEAQHDNHETTSHTWMRPQEALDLCAKEILNLRLPTIKTLEQFASCSTTSELLDVLSSSHAIPALLPRAMPDGRVVLPGEPGYDEN